jgi:hypothetical protein
MLCVSCVCVCVSLGTSILGHLHALVEAQAHVTVEKRLQVWLARSGHRV